MHSKRRHEGYLMIDNRQSPGVSADLVRRSGLDCQAVPAGGLFESATITCSHCQVVVVLNPDRTRERAHCRKCDHYICDGCAAAGDCTPFAKILDDAAEAIIRGQTPGALTHG